MAPRKLKKKPAPEITLLDACERVSDLCGAIIATRPIGKTTEAFRAVLAGSASAIMPEIETILNSVQRIVDEAGLSEGAPA